MENQPVQVKSLRLRVAYSDGTFRARAPNKQDLTTIRAIVVAFQAEEIELLKLHNKELRAALGASLLCKDAVA